MADGPKKIDRRIMEKSMRDIHKLLEQHDFESAEEANAFLADYVGPNATKELPSAREQTPLEKAQDLMHEAWDLEEGDKHRITLAEQAIALSPDCADAYIILAEEKAEKPEEKLDYFEKALEAGERALDPKLFDEEVGHFWGVLETRPYMRAKEALADALWIMERRNEAIEHYLEMMRLNPGDNQGIRYWLIPRLLTEKRTQEAEKFINEYREDMVTSWMYNRALLSYIQKGNRTIPKRNLKKAFEVNATVVAFMLGLEDLPDPEDPSALFNLGSSEENEALAYIFEAGEAWLETEGAFEWIAETLRNL